MGELRGAGGTMDEEENEEEEMFKLIARELRSSKTVEEVVYELVEAGLSRENAEKIEEAIAKVHAKRESQGGY